MKKETILLFGGDGYLGWTLGLALARRTNFRIVLIDNQIKRTWEKEVGAKSLVNFSKPEKRIEEYKKIFGKNNLSFEKADLLEYQKVVNLIKKYRPSIIINAAQQPSAPFSMMSAKNSATTFHNNILGNLHLLWAVREIDRDIKLIKLGSAGSYCGIDTDYLPLGKVDLKFNYKNKVKNILKSWLPMYATDFYHQTKITDFLVDELASSIWKLKIATVQQSTIFGATIEENHDQDRKTLSARFNYDAVFGTVINRFVCQSIIKKPLTVYGKGDQKTGIISLSDTIDNFINLVNMDIKPGKHVVVHNYTLRLSINEIAKKINAITGSKTSNIENPRKEEVGILSREVEVHPIISSSHRNKEEKFEKELRKLIEFTHRYKDNIDESLIMPKVTWQN